MKTRSAILAATAASLAFLPGCLTYKESLKLKKDGSGSITVTYALGKTAAAQLKSLKQMEAMVPGLGNVAMPLPFEEDVLKQQLTHKDLKLKKLTVAESGGMKIVMFQIEFEKVEDLSKLEFAPFKGSTFTFGEEEDADGDQPVLRWAYTRTLKAEGPNGVNQAISQAKSMPGAGDQADKALEDIKKKDGAPTLTFEVEMPDTVEQVRHVKDPKKQVKGKTVIWIEEKEMTDTGHEQEFWIRTRGRKP